MDLPSFICTQVPSLKGALSRQIEGLALHFPALQGVKRLYLYGSCARGEATYRSDVDLLAILTGPPRSQILSALRQAAEDELLQKGLSELLRAPLPAQIQAVSQDAETRFLVEVGAHRLLREWGEK